MKDRRDRKNRVIDREKQNAYYKRWRAANPEKVKAHNKRPAGSRRQSDLLSKYGIAISDFDALLAKQGGLCAICRTDTPGGRGKNFHVDHDHVTGKVRGLLCHGCNVGIGNLKDDPVRLMAAIQYLGRVR